MSRARVCAVSVVTLVPWSLGPLGQRMSAWIANLAGVKLQVLPLRGWNPPFYLPQGMVVSLEEAWNGGSLAGVVRRQVLKVSGEEDPLLVDWLLYGAKKSSAARYNALTQAYSQALEIIHASGNLPLEVNPECRMSWIDLCTYQPGLVIDTLHLGEVGRHQEPPVCRGEREVEAFLDCLDPSRILAIHVNARGPELKALLSGQNCWTAMVLRYLGEKTRDSKCPVVMEFSPFVDSPFGVARRLSEAKAMVLGLLDSV